MEIADNVFTYRGRPGDKVRPGAGSVNVTVVRGDGLLLLDTGVTRGGAFRELSERAAADGVAFRDVRWIAITHSHWDHFNAAGAVLGRAAARVAAGEADASLIEDARRNFAGFLTDFGELLPEVFPFPPLLARVLMWYTWGRQPALRVDRRLADGDTLDVGRSVRAVALPGHTAGHTGYFVPDTGVLVCGDLVDFENAHGMDLNNPRSDYAAAQASLERAMALEPEVLIPGHGAPTVGRAAVRALLERALEGGRRYPERIAAALGVRPVRLKAIVRQVFPDTPFSMEAMTCMLVLTVLLDMERRGTVRRDRANGRPAWGRVD